MTLVVEPPLWRDLIVELLQRVAPSLEVRFEHADLYVGDAQPAAGTVDLVVTDVAPASAANITLVLPTQWHDHSGVATDSMIGHLVVGEHRHPVPLPGIDSIVAEIVRLLA